jgi:hypothetical protein
VKCFFLSRVRPLACSLKLLFLQENRRTLWTRDPPSQGLRLHRTIQQKKRRHIFMRRLGPEPTIPVFGRCKPVHALDRTIIIISICEYAIKCSFYLLLLFTLKTESRLLDCVSCLQEMFLVQCSNFDGSDELRLHSANPLFALRNVMALQNIRIRQRNKKKIIKEPGKELREIHISPLNIKQMQD